MSEQQHPRRRDAGVTLIELLISVAMMGLLATSISAAIIVTLRSTQASEGRLNVARAEQNVAAWMPADLSSAVTASEEPGDSACGVSVAECGGVTGSNALLLSWPSHTTPGTDTTVSYVYRREASGDLFELMRVYCDAGSCSSNTILRELEGPENFEPGVTPVPDDVIDVTVPLVASAIDDTCATPDTPSLCANLDTGSTARRIVVTINGGGDVDGAGGGVNRVSITAGGTTLGAIDPETVTGPSFAQARSRCGGPITIVVDDSGSIGSSGGATDTENAVVGFVQALAGTPTSVKIVEFAQVADTIGSSDWDHRFEMTNPAHVTALVGDGGTNPGLIRTSLTQQNGTNWEDGLYRTFYAPNGDRLDADGDPTSVLPNLVVFFTDGIPTFNRTLGDAYRGDSPSGDPGLQADPAPRPSYWPQDGELIYGDTRSDFGNTFDQEGWDRSSAILSPFRNTDEVRLIGVGVGGISQQNIRTFTDSWINYWTGQGYNFYYGNTYLKAYRSGSVVSLNKNTPSEKALGNLIAGGSIHASDDNPYVTSTYDSATDTWLNAETADMFITSDFDKLPSALSTIAVGQCGGTLTLQTNLNGSPAPSNVTYESDGQTVTTSLINRAATFDVTVPGGAAVDAVVTPQSFDTTGYTANSWTCESKGAAISPGPSTWSLVDSADAGQGINVRVAANQAVACTLTVSNTP